MAATPHATGPKRLLLVTADPDLIDATKNAARLLGVPVDVLPTVDAALAWLLHPHAACTHLLAPANLPPAEIDALTGMLDEATEGRSTVFLLGGPYFAGRSLAGVDPPDAATIAAAVQDCPSVPPPGTPALDAETLRLSLHRGGLRMHFQPVLDARSLRMIGVEALARLNHPALGILRPQDFIPLAVASAQERTLSNVAAARAMVELRGRPFMQGRRVSFNMPLPGFLAAFAPAEAQERCAIAHLPPERVTIELLETDAAPPLPALSAAVTRWRDAGFRVCIDDAGPRLPHWRALLDLPFNAIKLDGALAGASQDMANLAATIVEAAKRRDLLVVAEGIEDAAALDRMRGLGVDALQGYLFCRPVPARALQLWDQAWEALLGSAA